MSDEETDQVPDLEQLEREVEITAYQASGPGGQHRNRTYSAIRMTHPPTGITVTASESRSQHRNRKIALQRLHARLVEHFKPEIPRIPTRKSRAVQQRERQERSRMTDKKNKRQRTDLDQE